MDAHWIPCFESPHPALGASGEWKRVALPSSIPNTCFVTVGLFTDAGLLALFFFSFFFPF